MRVRDLSRLRLPALAARLAFSALFCFVLVLPAAGRPRRSDPPDQVASESWPQPAPRFYGTEKDWINTDGKPLKMEELIRQHRPIMIDFWEYTCVNCLRTLPYIKEWQKRYAKYGLVIVGVHTPEFKFAHDRDNVAAAVKRLGITWPVLVDSDYQNWSAYQNSYWPRHYFIDGKGRIVEDHAGEGGYEESEATIQRLLKQIHPNLHFPHPMLAVRDTDKPGARCYPMTPELYAGLRGSQSGQLGNIDPFTPNTLGTFAAPAADLPDGRIYAVGTWRMQEESLQHGQEAANLNDKILLRYHALEANAVIKPEKGAPLKVYVTQDSRPVAKKDRGDDIQYDPDGASYLLVDQPRMYRLTKNARFGSHLLTLASRSSGFGLYSFTFSSCEEK